jgi:hypothetical protein
VKNSQSTSYTDLKRRFLTLELGPEEAPAVALVIKHFQLFRENSEKPTLPAMSADPPI